jgi:glycosyltransferase involved in cell wall biosynthesis
VDRKRVLVLLPCFTHGGAEKQGALLAKHLKDSGHEVEVWGFPTLSEDSPLKDTLAAWGVPHTELPRWPQFDWSFADGPLSLRRLKRRFLDWPRQIAGYATALPARRFDTIVPFTPTPSLVAILLRRRLGAARVFWNHRGGMHPGGMRYTDFIVRQILSHRPGFIANSAAGAEFVRQTFGLTPGQVALIPNAFVSDDPDGTVSSERPASGRPLTLLQLANFFGEKDGATPLRAMALLKARGVECRLLLAGHFPDPSYRQLIEGLMDELKVRDRVELLGPVDRSQVHHLLRAADVGVLSSLSEGTPNSVMEYMDASLPVVATDIPGIRGVVGEGNAPWLFAVGDHERMAQLVEQLAGSPDTRAALGSANRRRVIDEYLPEKVFAQWDRLLFPS